MASSAYDRAFARLASLTNYETMASVRYDARTYGLHRVRRLLREAGDPGDGLPVLQVVGSKGKGTAARASSRILAAAGVRTGTFLSPHLVHPRERILVDGRPVPARRFAAAVDRVLPPALERPPGERPTFFELMTAAAMVAFEDAGVGAVVLEAGMGGRLDATTAVRRSAVLLTSVSRDHVRQLGCTLSAIAGEKIAVARRGVPVYSAVPGRSRPGGVIAERCRRVGAALRVAGRDWTVEDAVTALGARGPRTSFTLRVEGAPALETLSLPLLGTHQASNAALASFALLDLGRRGVLPCEPEHVRRGLGRVTSPGRLEVMGRAPLLLLDGAHNGASMRAAVDAVTAVAPPGARLHLLIAMQRDKEFDDVFAAIPRGTRVVVTQTTGARAKPAVELAEVARRRGLRATVERNPLRAVERARAKAAPGDVVLIAGSLYLVGLLRPSLVP